MVLVPLVCPPKLHQMHILVRIAQLIQDQIVINQLVLLILVQQVKRKMPMEPVLNVLLQSMHLILTHALLVLLTQDQVLINHPV